MRRRVPRINTIQPYSRFSVNCFLQRRHTHLSQGRLNYLSMAHPFPHAFQAMRHIAMAAWICFPFVWVLHYFDVIGMATTETIDVVGDICVKMGTSALLGLLSLLASERDLFAAELEKFVAEFELVLAHFEQVLYPYAFFYHIVCICLPRIVFLELFASGECQTQTRVSPPP